MIDDGSVVLTAAGRDWNFKVTVGQWIRLQTHFGGGPQKISARFGSDDWTIEDVREMIERGLEGGGLPVNEAREAATSIMNGQPLDPNYKLAIDVLGAAWAGMDEYMKKKAVVEVATAALSRMATGNGISQISSEPASSPVSSHPKPKSSVSANSSP
jgi:hypothetical protein